LASSSRHIGMTSIYDELLTAQYGNQFFKIHLPLSAPNMAVSALRQHLQERFTAILVAVESERPDLPMTVNPAADKVVRAGQSIVVISEAEPDLRRWNA
ncbi:MAG: hypothetical protein ACI81R_002831, partial [Bradymonadia bacterium]